MIFKAILGATLMLVTSATSALAQNTGGPTATTATYGDWTMRCNQVQIADTAGSPTNACEIATQVNIRDEAGNTGTLIQMVIGKVPGSETIRMVILVPQASFLRVPVGVTLDPPEAEEGAEIAEPTLSATYLQCGVGGCVADAELDAGIVTRITDATTAQVSYADLSGNIIGVPLSLNGFGDAVDAMALVP